MKIALLSDIHANLHALTAVLVHAKKQGADTFWDLGDFLGFGACPEETVEILRKNKFLCITGNFDKRIMKYPRKAGQWQDEKDPDKFLMIKYSYESLSSGSRKFVSGLPAKRIIRIDGKKVMMVHASPESDKEHLGPDTPPSCLRELAKDTGCDIILCGHSHRQFVKKTGKTLFVNPGTVGLPDDGDTRASYAIMDTGKKRTEIEHFKVRYDVKAAAEAVISRGLPEIFSIMILKARNYSWTMEEEGKRLGRLTVQAMEYAEKCLFEEGHALQTAKLSLKIYDGLECLHGLSSEDRVLLNCAAILHDIGISAGGRAHHKRSMDMIMAAGLPAFTEREKLIVALIARYHRKTLPAVGHPGYSGICGEDKRRVDVLAGILRVADGLDRTHTNAVTDIACEILPGRILIKCSASRPASSEIRWGKTKSDLMQKAFNRIVEIE